jgi:hypothetical protein
MSEPPPQPAGGLSRTQILLLTMAVEVIGVLVIAFAVPVAWSTRLVVIAVYVLLANAASRLYLGRQNP